jgi:mono/diheme cytochrome c family protein
MPFALSMLAACQQSAPESPHAQEVLDGRTAFETYCASCHGLDARGNGPVASVLTTAPPDLTQLKARFEGVFPSEYVLRTIDGRHEFMAHGTRQMPIWGNVWREDTAGVFDEEVEAQRKMNIMLHYLESIQEDQE